MTDSAPNRPLRRGWTTGTCAAAAAAAAYEALVTAKRPQTVTVQLPRGGSATLAIRQHAADSGSCSASVIKDAGDDPDVTHGAEVVAAVRFGEPASGVQFEAGDGVGTVTLPGLPVAVGEPAINPGPRQMIRDAIAAVADAIGTTTDVVVTISILGGRALAERTLNARLGVEGGLSILGTTGVVVPFSCASWIHSIHRGIDVARAAGLRHLAAATGSTSEKAVQRLYDLPDRALIDMGDFVGGTLSYVRRHPVSRLTLAGGFAKLAKLAQGHFFLHSSKSTVDIGRLADRLGELGAPGEIVTAARSARSAAQILGLAEASGLELGDAVAADARRAALGKLGDGVPLDVVVFDRAGRPVGRTAP